LCNDFYNLKYYSHNIIYKLVWWEKNLRKFVSAVVFKYQSSHHNYTTQLLEIKYYLVFKIIIKIYDGVL